LSNYESHAWREFRAAGWVDENNKFNDEMQEAICTNVLKMLEIFADEGHSGSSAPYAINLFEKIASFKPLSPLTGEDWEWHDVSDYGGRDDGPVFQNKRSGNVFKDNNGAYDIQGIVWYDWYTDEETGEKRKSHFTNYKSRVAVTFPYTPKTEYKEWVEDEKSV
jgi:hypothetical protein